MLQRTRTISVRIPEDLADRLDEISSQSGISASVLTRRAVEEFCDEVSRTGRVDLSCTVEIGTVGKSQTNRPFSTVVGTPAIRTGPSTRSPDDYIPPGATLPQKIVPAATRQARKKAA